MLEPWKVLNSTTSYEDSWLKVRSDTCLTRKGQVIAPFHVLEYPTWVNIVAITNDSQIVLVREYRHGANQIMTELPSGSMEAYDETPLCAIQRELQEETGYSGGVFFEIGRTYANPANQNNTVVSFIAINVKQNHLLSLDPNEDIEVVKLPFVHFVQETWRGDIKMQGLHLATIHFALHFIFTSQQPELRDLCHSLRQLYFSVWQ